MQQDFSYLTALQAPMNAEVERRETIKERVKALEASSRAVQATLNRVYGSHDLSPANVAGICAAAEAQMEQVRGDLAVLAQCIPAGQYYRYAEHWTRTLQQLCFLSTFFVYLSNEGSLITVDQLERLLGVPLNQPQTFHVPVEDFLLGMVSLSNELSRLAVTAVIAADYQRPLRIASFLEELYNGFQLLNLRNDLLRKRFDSMKYDIKKIEEVVYNITLRGLVSSNTK